MSQITIVMIIMITRAASVGLKHLPVCLQFSVQAPEAVCQLVNLTKHCENCENHDIGVCVIMKTEAFGQWWIRTSVMVAMLRIMMMIDSLDSWSGQTFFFFFFFFEDYDDELMINSLGSWSGQFFFFFFFRIMMMINSLDSWSGQTFFF